MNKQAIIWIVGIGCAGCLILSVVALVFGGLFMSFILQEPENININLEAPTTVQQDEEFAINVYIENTANQNQTLDSVDFTFSYLEGLIIESSEPPFTESSTIPIIEYESYTFEKTIAPGEELTVTFTVTALEIGAYSGEVDICINNESACSTRIIRTTVEE